MTSKDHEPTLDELMEVYAACEKVIKGYPESHPQRQHILNQMTELRTRIKVERDQHGTDHCISNGPRV